MIDLSQEQKVAAALHEHGTQAELLRHQTDLDFRIFGGYITLQLAFGGWMAAHPVPAVQARLGLTVIDLALGLLTGVLLWRNSVRRRQVVAVLRRVNDALGYTTPGVYLQDRALHEPVPLVLWLPYYLVGIVLGVVGVWILLYQPVPA